MANDDVLWKQIATLQAGKPKTTATPLRAKPYKRSHPLSNRRQPAKRPAAASPDQPSDPLVDQPGTGSTGPTTGQLAGQVVNRPVSFYIPLSINAKIDEAVDYMEKRHGVKVDRSAIVSALLGEAALWEAASLNRLVEKAVQQLTNRLTSRLVSRLVSRPIS